MGSWLACSTPDGAGSGFEPSWGHCVVLLGKTIHSQGASLYPGVQMSSVEFNDGVRVLGSCDGLTSHPRMSRNTHSHFMLQTVG